MAQSPSLPNSRLVVAASCLIVMGALLHACGGGGGGGGGGNPPAPAPPGNTTFSTTFQYPALSATNVPLRPIVILGFNDTVNPATAIAANITLSDGLGPVPLDITYGTCNNRIQLIPTVPLASSTVYTVNLTAGLQDDDAEALTPFTYTFTTIASTDSTRPTMSAFMVVPNPGNQTDQLLVTWTDADDGANPAAGISYRVYVSTTDCFSFNIPTSNPVTNPTVTVGPGVLQAIVPGLASRTAYNVIVRAVDASLNESTNVTPIQVSTFTSLAQDVFQLVSTRCVSCHNPGGQAVLQGINMNYSTPQTTRTSWVGAASQCANAAASGFPTRVVVGNPNTSFLYNKVAGLPVCGGQMPLGQAPLDANTELPIIFDWITEGALDN